MSPAQAKTDEKLPKAQEMTGRRILKFNILLQDIDPPRFAFAKFTVQGPFDLSISLYIRKPDGTLP